MSYTEKMAHQKPAWKQTETKLLEKLMQDDSSNKDDISKSGPALTLNMQSEKPW